MTFTRIKDCTCARCRNDVIPPSIWGVQSPRSGVTGECPICHGVSVRDDPEHAFCAHAVSHTLTCNSLVTCPPKRRHKPPTDRKDFTKWRPKTNG